MGYVSSFEKDIKEYIIIIMNRTIELCSKHKWLIAGGFKPSNL